MVVVHYIDFWYVHNKYPSHEPSPLFLSLSCEQSKRLPVLGFLVSGFRRLSLLSRSCMHSAARYIERWPSSSVAFAECERVGRTDEACFGAVRTDG